MIRYGWLAAAFVGMVTNAASAQGPTNWAFRWTKGETLDYRVRHVTAVTETVGGRASETSAKLDIGKRWRVLDVDAAGTATLELSLFAMRNEQKRPGGDVLLFDSDKLDASTPELRGMAKFLNTPIAKIRIDRLGRVVETLTGPKGKYEQEPPFAAIVPDAVPAAGQVWVAPFTLVVDPPLGAGEKYPAERKFACEKIEAGKAILSVAVAVKNPPETVQDQVPLLQKEGAGRIVFDVASGRMESVRIAIDRTIENHQGQGSRYRFASEYVEERSSGSAVVPAGGVR